MPGSIRGFLIHLIWDGAGECAYLTPYSQVMPMMLVQRSTSHTLTQPPAVFLHTLLHCLWSFTLLPPPLCLFFALLAVTHFPGLSILLFPLRTFPKYTFSLSLRCSTESYCTPVLSHSIMVSYSFFGIPHSYLLDCIFHCCIFIA